MGCSFDSALNVATLGASDALGITDSKDIAGSYDAAAQAQVEASEASIAYQEELFDKQAELIEPWRAAGERALQVIEETPDFNFTSEDFTNFQDPSYDFRMEEGINALDRSAASRGRLLSGAQDRAVTRYGSELASTEYGNAFNRALTTYQQNLGTQQSLAGVGQTATQQVQQAGNILGQNVTQATTDIGSAVAQQNVQTANYNAAMGSNLLGMAGTAIGVIASDRRLKDNIVFIGEENGHKIYTWDWKNKEHEHLINKGVIAQEVEEYMPEAVITMENGYKSVDYTKLGFKDGNISISA